MDTPRRSRVERGARSFGSIMWDFVPANLVPSIQRLVARTRIELEHRGIDTAGMAPGQILKRAQDARRSSEKVRAAAAHARAKRKAS
jgi:hypothetical protein